MSLKLLLIFLRSSLLTERILKGKPLLWTIDKLSQNYDINICLILAELVNSNSPRYSERLLTLLLAVPKEPLESHKSLRTHFLSQMRCESVRDALKTCRQAIILCFTAK